MKDCTIEEKLMIDRALCSKWTKYLFALSAAAFIGLQASLSGINILGIIAIALNILIVFIIVILAERRYNILNILFKIRSRKAAIISLFISAYSLVEIPIKAYTIFVHKIEVEFAYVGSTFIQQNRTIFSETMFTHILIAGLIVASIIASFFVYTIIYAMVSRFKRQTVVNIWRDADKIERVYFITAVIFFSCLIAYVYSQSTVFSGVTGSMDQILRMDIGYIKSNLGLYWGTAGTITHFFRHVIQTPIVLVAQICARLLFFVPPALSYTFQLCHVILMISSGILLSRMSAIKDVSKIVFLLGYTVSYSFLVFSISLERYIMPTFCMILLVYAYINKQKNISIIAQIAAGSLTTNLIIFPFLSYDKDMKIWLINFAKYLLAFILICVFCGRLSTIMLSGELLFMNLKQFAGGDVTYEDRALQFLNFVSSCFIKPEIVINPDLSYNMARPSFINWTGFVLISLTVTGFILNRKNRFAQIAFLWVIYSFVILFVIGWQSKHNEMFLCTLYFGWAFYSLIFMLIEKVFENFRAIRYIASSAVLVAMTVINVPGIIDLIDFGIQYYPVK